MGRTVVKALFRSLACSSVLLADQEAAAAEDQEQRRDEDHRRERVDNRAYAEFDHGVYLQRQRARTHPAYEVRDDEVVERERERQEAARHAAGQDQGQRHPEEGLQGARAEVLGRLLDRAVHTGEAGAHDHSAAWDRETPRGSQRGRPAAATERAMPARRARTTIVTNEIVNATWAITMVVMPSWKPTATKKTSRLTPTT